MKIFIKIIMNSSTAKGNIPNAPKKQKPPKCVRTKTPVAVVSILNEKYRQNIENANNT
jgi:hypothetical protein